MMDESKIRLHAFEDAIANDGLEEFVHRTLLRIVDEQGLKQQSGGDGYFKGEFDINSAAEHLKLALTARDDLMMKRSGR